jgi:hypothetical protein
MRNGMRLQTVDTNESYPKGRSMTINTITSLPTPPKGRSLLCPHSGHPIRRAIIVDQSGGPMSYLHAVARICKECGVWPVLLTIARSEDEALCRQIAAEGVFSEFGLQGDFDYVLGTDVVDAVSWSARWRHCSHAFVATSQVTPWWRIWRRDPVGRLVDLSNALTLLTIGDAEEQSESHLCARVES